ncbi:hypothetical protein [Pasteuria penetrans]|uniref:hypothetical protein n=1 Tax=Pasteuria penetrans TaxID=86005 RepID=UPI000FAD6AA5|nr:hypothetical protein [Pasteuria penetrans]
MGGRHSEGSSSSKKGNATSTPNQPNPSPQRAGHSRLQERGQRRSKQSSTKTPSSG